MASYTHGLGIDEPLIMERGGNSFFYHADGLGSITDLTDNLGAVVQSYVYDSFGNIVLQNGSLVNPYTYTGREFDSESGLYYYRARYYDSAIGRFLQEDPFNIAKVQVPNLLITEEFFTNIPDIPVLAQLGLQINPSSLHRYSYTLNNPINFIDPHGLILTFPDQLIGGGLVIGGVVILSGGGAVVGGVLIVAGGAVLILNPISTFIQKGLEEEAETVGKKLREREKRMLNPPTCPLK